MDANMLFLIIFIILMAVMMWWSSRKSKQQQAQVKDFRASLAPGTLVSTIGGVIGTVVSVDTKYEEIVIDSEGSQLRFKFSAVNREYVRPAYVDDDDVDEQGNPIVPAVESGETDQKLADSSADAQDNENKESAETPSTLSADELRQDDSVPSQSSSEEDEAADTDESKSDHE